MACNAKTGASGTPMVFLLLLMRQHLLRALRVDRLLRRLVPLLNNSGALEIEQNPMYGILSNKRRKNRLWQFEVDLKPHPNVPRIVTCHLPL